jgi:hypothetical protein
VLLHLDDEHAFFSLDVQRIVDAGQIARRKLGVDDHARHAGD